MTTLLALPVAVPLLCAALVAAVGSFVSPWSRHVLAIAAAAVACAVSLVLLVHTQRHDLVLWVGGWHPRHGVAIGVALAADPFGAGMAALSAGLVTFALAFAWTYIVSASPFFEVLMLIFCGAICGFALTGDLFNMFVWFELSGVAAYALAGFDVEELGPVQGAFNFAITNTVGAYLMLTGIALVYARTGALNLAQIGRALGHRQPDELVAVALTLVVVGFLVRAAVVPFHFWLADAHAVAPAPVCALFSGAMVELGLFAVARVWWTAFEPAVAHAAVVRDVLLTIGILTALLGALMCFLQRHLKRMLAYSTISHAGIILAAIALLGVRGLAGAANLVISHAFLKGALFLACGVLLHRFRDVDELRLHGRGRGSRLLGALFGAAAVGLIGVPYVGAFLGQDLIDQSAAGAGMPWVAAVVMFAAGVSAGTILRAGARVFLGWGGARDPLLSPEPQENETERSASVPLMLGVIAVMVALGLAESVVPGLQARSELAAAHFREPGAYAARILHGASRNRPATPPFDVPAAPAESWAYALGAAGVAVATAACGLYRTRLPRGVRLSGDRLLGPPLRVVRDAHSGLIGDYITWLAVGTAAIGTIWVLGLR